MTTDPGKPEAGEVIAFPWGAQERSARLHVVIGPAPGFAGTWWGHMCQAATVSDLAAAGFVPASRVEEESGRAEEWKETADQRLRELTAASLLASELRERAERAEGKLEGSVMNNGTLMREADGLRRQLADERAGRERAEAAAVRRIGELEEAVADVADGFEQQGKHGLAGQLRQFLPATLPPATGPTPAPPSEAPALPVTEGVNKTIALMLPVVMAALDAVERDQKRRNENSNNRYTWAEVQTAYNKLGKAVAEYRTALRSQPTVEANPLPSTRIYGGNAMPVATTAEGERCEYLSTFGVGSQCTKPRGHAGLHRVLRPELFVDEGDVLSEPPPASPPASDAGGEIPDPSRCCFQSDDVETCGALATIDAMCEAHARVVHGRVLDRAAVDDSFERWMGAAETRFRQQKGDQPPLGSPTHVYNLEAVLEHLLKATRRLSPPPSALGPVELMIAALRNTQARENNSHGDILGRLADELARMQKGER